MSVSDRGIPTQNKTPAIFSWGVLNDTEFGASSNEAYKMAAFLQMAFQIDFS